MRSMWYGMVEVCEGAPVAVGGWVLTYRHDLAPCRAYTICTRHLQRQWGCRRVLYGMVS